SSVLVQMPPSMLTIRRPGYFVAVNMPRGMLADTRGCRVRGARHHERRDRQLREPLRDKLLYFRLPLVLGGRQEIGHVFRRQMRSQEHQPTQVNMALGQRIEDPWTASPHPGDLDPFGGCILRQP